jgi:hypothetical protein
MPKSALTLPDPAAFIFTVRSHRVILDAHLALIYGVPTKRLNEQVKRNIERFPDDFRFQLTTEELTAVQADLPDAMRSQFATASKRNVRFHPYVFTEHGTLMAANVLNSPQAILMSVQVIRAFTRLREMALSVSELAAKVRQLEAGFRKHGEQFQVVFDALRQLLNPPEKPKKRIGFHGDK